jgi:hypothetical protein
MSDRVYNVGFIANTKVGFHNRKPTFSYVDKK